MAQPEPKSSDEKKTPGQILKEIRTSKGISLETVHNATKMPLDALKAIEEGYQVRTLSPFYIKGFIKMYAEYLGVDVSDVLEDYHKEHLPGPARRSYAEDSLEKRIKKIFTRERQQQVVKILIGVFVVFVIFKVGGCFFRKREVARPPAPKATPIKTKKKETKAEAKKVAQKPVSQPVSQPKKPEEKKTAARVETPAPQKKPPPAPAPKAEPAKNVRLTIRTRRQGWLQVKVDGNLVFQSTIKEGAVETWEADDKIEISGKNIHNLEFEVNGKVLGTLGRADRSARRVVISQDGLKVIQ